ncbi:MAG: barstar family protein [Gemmatimonadaceae bacterium]|nr:barstar family protein [Gemmatimonadaceae bacterium]
MNTAVIIDEASFHEECRRALEFPDFYGRNWDAWSDCMGYLREPEARMIGVQLGRDELLHLEIPDAEALSARAPDVVRTLIECTAFVNRRSYLSVGEPAAIAVLFT